MDVIWEWRWSLGLAVLVGSIIDIPVLMIVVPGGCLYIGPRGALRRDRR